VNNQFQGDLTASVCPKQPTERVKRGAYPLWGWLPAGTREPWPYLLRQPRACADSRTFVSVLLSRSYSGKDMRMKDTTQEPRKRGTRTRR